MRTVLAGAAGVLLGAILAAAAMPRGSAPTPGGAVVRAEDGGRLIVSNPGSAPVRLRGAVVVEGYDGRDWKPLVTEMNLVRACPANGVVMGEAPPVALRPGETLSPPGWRGWSCAGQCETHCRSNIYWGSGPFRFRITGAAGGAVVSNSFRMPGRPSR